jgi:hypothetical protein
MYTRAMMWQRTVVFKSGSCGLRLGDGLGRLTDGRRRCRHGHRIVLLQREKRREIVNLGTAVILQCVPLRVLLRRWLKAA